MSAQKAIRPRLVSVLLVVVMVWRWWRLGEEGMGEWNERVMEGRQDFRVRGD